MPLKLTVGLSKKVGLPNYGSLGATCGLEVVLEDGLLSDRDTFHAEVRDAFGAARRAVDDELDRLRAAPPVKTEPGPPARPPADGRAGKAATPNQVRAILSIAHRQRADLDGLLCDLNVTRPEELTLAQASRLIDRLKAVGAC